MNRKQTLGFSLLVFFMITGVGASDYLGPNRSRTTYSNERKQCYYTADGTYGGTHYGCHLNLYTDPGSACDSSGSVAVYFNQVECGWPVGVDCGTMHGCSYGGPSESLIGCHSGDTGCRSVGNTTVYPEATVSGSMSCSNPGSSGWCIGSASLNISATEPVAGYNILDVEGTRNGASFACAGASCSVPLLEGDNSFSFWALSSWGDSSSMGSASGGVDTQPPALSGALSGVTGDGGWFVSSVSATAAASDGTSGIGSVVYSLDGGAQTAYSGAVTLGEGTHTIVFYAMDRAGNSSSVSLSANVDTISPAITIDPASGTLGDNGWFVSDATLSTSAADTGSGLASLEYSLDGGAQTAYTGAIPMSDGSHTVVFTATDLAGNGSTATQSVNVDTLAPNLNLTGNSNFCPACGETLAIGYSAGDSGSGIAEWTLLADGTLLSSGTAAESGTFDWDGGGLAPGAHTITLQGKDLAGNTAQVDLAVTIQEPTPTPVVSLGGGSGSGDVPVRRPAATRTPNPTSTATSTSTVQRGQGSSSSGQSTAIPTATRTDSIIVAISNPPQGPGEAETISNPITTSSIPLNGALFGAEAAAVIGAATALALDQKRKREEEEAQAAAAAAQFNSAQIALEEQRRREAAQRAWDKKQQEDAKAAEEAANQAFQAKLSEAMGAGLPPMQVNDYIEMAKTSGYAAATAALCAYIDQAKKDAAAAEAFQKYMKEKEAQEAAEKARKEAEEKARQEAAAAAAAQQAAAAAAAAAVAAEAEKNKPWWQKAIDFVDQHQKEIAIGIGIVAGVAAIVLTAGTATPLVLAAGAAALGAGVVVGAGTVGLNAYYDRSWDQNLIRNVGLAATSAVVTTVAPAFIQAGQAVVATAVPYMAAAAGVPIAIAQGLAGAVAPIIGFGTSMLALGSMAVGGAGMSMSLDPTLSDEERQLGANMTFASLIPLTIAQGIYNTASTIDTSPSDGVKPSTAGGASIVYDAKLGKYVDTSNGTIVPPGDIPWPTNNGFSINPSDTPLIPGEVIDRFGTLTGQYAGVPGTSIPERGMAPGSENMPYTRLEVIRPFTVPSGPAAAVPAFGADGGGIQYFFKGGLQWWIDNGYLRIIP